MPVTASSFFHRPKLARALTALALLGFALRAVMPAGFMFAPAGGHMTVVLCTGHGPELVKLDLGDHTPGKDTPKNGKAEAPCVFAAAAHLASPERAPIAAPLALAYVPAPPLAPQAQPGRGLAAPPPWSTGPPALV